MVDRFAETVKDGCGAIGDAVGDVVVSVTEVIVARIIFIQMKERENVADIHQTAAGVDQRGIVQTGKREVEFFEAFADVPAGHFVGDGRSEIAAVEFADFGAGSGGEEPLNFSDVAHNLILSAKMI